MKNKKWLFLIPVIIIVLIIVISFSRVSYREVDNLTDFESFFWMSEPSFLEYIEQVITEQQGLTPEYISINQGEMDQLHKAVINSIDVIYDEGPLQHRMVNYYYDEDSNKCYFFSSGVLLHGEVYGYYDYDEGNLWIIHGMF